MTEPLENLTGEPNPERSRCPVLHEIEPGDTVRRIPRAFSHEVVGNGSHKFKFIYAGSSPIDPPEGINAKQKHLPFFLEKEVVFPEAFSFRDARRFVSLVNFGVLSSSHMQILADWLGDHYSGELADSFLGIGNLPFEFQSQSGFSIHSWQNIFKMNSVVSATTTIMAQTIENYGTQERDGYYVNHVTFKDMYDLASVGEGGDEEFNLRLTAVEQTFIHIRRVLSQKLQKYAATAFGRKDIIASASAKLAENSLIENSDMQRISGELAESIYYLVVKLRANLKQPPAELAKTIPLINAALLGEKKNSIRQLLTSKADLQALKELSGAHAKFAKGIVRGREVITVVDMSYRIWSDSQRTTLFILPIDIKGRDGVYRTILFVPPVVCPFIADRLISDPENNLGNHSGHNGCPIEH